jgi:hypothetical protein
MKLFFSLVCAFSFFCVQAQKPSDLDKKPSDLDNSPMDMSYWPMNYPLLKMRGQAKSMPVARIIYGRPIKNGRVIFGNLQKYGALWRLGANESTEIEFFSNVKIGGRQINKGRYTMYCIPYENKWTLIINGNNYTWGDFKYDSKKDIVRKDVDIDRNTETIEALYMYFDETKTGANLIFLWDDLKASLPITLINK